MASEPLILDNFLTFTIGILVYFAGVLINRKVSFLREYNIPEPVTGGLVASMVALALYLLIDIELNYTLELRDVLLVYFFTSIGLNARFSDLVSGGKPLILLLIITVLYIVFQDIVGVVTASLIGLPNAMGVLAGSASLIGGHGTAIAWSPEIAQSHGIANALEVGVSAATLGLIMASLLGGPAAKYLLNKHQLSGKTDQPITVGVSYEHEDSSTLTHINFMGTILVLHVCIILGYILNMSFTEFGLKLPLFVTCLLVAIFLSNIVPKVAPQLPWPAHSKSLSVLSDFSLSLFIAMSLMGMQLWAIADLAGPLFIILAAQGLLTLLFVIFIFYRLMGADYQAVVLSSGFIGISLGATPTAIANMTAVTKSHGAAPTAFIILPLVGAFFVDIANSFIIQFFLGL